MPARWGENVGDVTAAALSPDGALVYFTVRTEALSGVVMFNAAAPYLAAVVAVLAFIVLLMGARRVVRAPQRRDRVYCRRCNYDVSASEIKSERVGRCSECGVKLDNRTRRRGRPVLARLVPTSLWCVVMTALCIALVRAPRWSDRPLKWAGLSLLERSRTIESVFRPATLAKILKPAIHVCVAPSGGGQHRVLRLHASTIGAMTIAPDGRCLFLFDDVDGFVRLDSRTAAVLDVAPMGDRGPADEFNPFVIAFTPDGSGAYVQWVEPHHRATVGPYSRKCGVSLWSLEENAITDLVVAECWYDRGVHVGFPSEFAVARVGAEWQVVEWPTTMQAYKTGWWLLRLHSARGPVELGNVVGVDNAAHPVVSVGLRKLYVRDYSDKIVEGSIDDPKKYNYVRAPSKDGFNRPLAMCESRQWLWAYAMNDSFYIRDIRNGRWLAACAIPKRSFLSSPAFSQDGSRVLAILREDPTTPEAKQNTHDLLVWDLRGLCEMTTESD